MRLLHRLIQAECSSSHKRRGGGEVFAPAGLGGGIENRSKTGGNLGSRVLEVAERTRGSERTV